MGKPYVTRNIRGIEHKLCRGPSHTEPTWLPVGQFAVRSDRPGKMRGRLRGSCKSCEHNYRYGKAIPISGWKPIGKYLFAIFELERRLGRTEAARRTGVGKTTWYRWTTQKATRIQAGKALMLLKTLAEVREAGEVRSKNDINYGRAARGMTETPPAGPRDYYVSDGDEQTLAKNPNPQTMSRMFTPRAGRKLGGNARSFKKRRGRRPKG